MFLTCVLHVADNGEKCYITCKLACLRSRHGSSHDCILQGSLHLIAVSRPATLSITCTVTVTSVGVCTNHTISCVHLWFAACWPSCRLVQSFGMDKAMVMYVPVYSFSNNKLMTSGSLPACCSASHFPSLTHTSDFPVYYTLSTSLLGLAVSLVPLAEPSNLSNTAFLGGGGT